MRFDRLGIEVVYEPDKVFLAPKWSYVPDFFVKPWSAYVEIKPLSPTQDARKKAALLARKTHALVHVFAGQESIQIWGLRRPSFILLDREIGVPTAEYAR